MNICSQLYYMSITVLLNFQNAIAATMYGPYQGPYNFIPCYFVQKE